MPQPYRIDAINGLRGLAIIGVVFHHSFAKLFSSSDTPYGFLGMTFARVPFLTDGMLGVDLFFVLSGFVLFLPYALGRRNLDGNGIRQYYWRRFLRLAPLYGLCILVCTTFSYPASAYSKAYYEQIFYLFSVTFPFSEANFYPTPNWVLWSLGVEIWFSVIFPPV